MSKITKKLLIFFTLGILFIFSILIFFGEVNTNENNKYGENYDKIYALKFSLDGKYLTYFGENNGQYFLVKDLVGDNNSHEVSSSSPSYEEKAGKWINMTSNSTTVNSGYDFVSSLKYTKDGNNYAFVAEKNKKKFIVKDGVEGNKYDDICFFEFSPDGKSFAYVAKNNDRPFNISRDYNIIGVSSNIKIAQPSPSKLKSMTGDWFIVKDGVEIKNYDSTNSPTFSPDSKNFAYVAEKYGQFFVIQETIDFTKKSYLNQKILILVSLMIIFGFGLIIYKVKNKKYNIFLVINWITGNKK